MVVNFSVFLKVPFVIPGRYDGLIRYRKNGYNCPIFCKWFLDTDPEVGTASDADTASRESAGIFLDKPHPFIYLCGIYGNDKSQYPSYMDGTRKVMAGDEIYICGDSYSDLLGAESVRANFIGVSGGPGGERLSLLCKEKRFLCIGGILEVLDILK